MKSLSALLALSLAVATDPLHAAAVKDREGAVRQDKATMSDDARWIYNDVDRGFAEAKKTGRPLLVVLRCVPCLSCVGLDAEVLKEPALSPLLDQFVCVRLINANAIDLQRFQFDYDLSFNTLFFNADGTVYGRYGSWVHQADPEARETIGYRRALEAALVLHRGYPANRESLAGKQGGPTPFRTPVEIPALAGKYGRELNWSGNVVQSCVHCHQVGEAFRTYYREKKQPVPLDLVYPLPASETVGLSLAPDQAATVTAVAPQSAAARAGFQPGDVVVSFGGQPLISIADFSWVLHRASAEAKLAAVVQRGTKTLPLQLDLASGWRTKSEIARRVGTWSMRAMAFGGLVLEELDDAGRKERSLAAEALALRVKNLGQYNKHGTAKKMGFLKDDVIVAFAGRTSRATEGELIGDILTHHPIGETIDVTVLRGSERVTLKLPMQ